MGFHRNLEGADLHPPSNVVVENNTGGTLTKLTCVKYTTFGTNFIQVDTASGAVDTVDGITRADIITGSTGQIVSIGFINNANTSSFSAGNLLYADSSGQLTTTVSATGQVVAKVITVDATDGIIQVNLIGSALAGVGKFKVSSNDTVLDFAINKLTADIGLKWTEINNGGDEDLQVGLDFNALPEETAVLSGDKFFFYDVSENLHVFLTFGTLEQKLNHDNLDGFVGNEHRLLDDASTTTTNLWSANKIDSELSGLGLGFDYKESCRICTSANLTGYSSSGGSGGTGNFTPVDTTSGALFDGLVDKDSASITLVANDRILVKSQTDAKENGIYIVVTAGVSGELERSADMDGSPTNEVSGGNTTYSEGGTTCTDLRFTLSGDGDLTLNTNDLDWVQTGSGAGEINTASNVNVGGVGIFKQKTGVDLEFNGINAGSSKITVVLDAGNNEIDIDVAEANLTIANMGDEANYFLLGGRSGGQTGIGGTVSGNDLTFQSNTSNDGDIIFGSSTGMIFDETNGRLGLGIAIPTHSLHIIGDMELDHIAASTDEHAFELTCNAAGFGDNKCININYITGALAAGSDEEVILINIDESLSTSGSIAGLEVLSTTGLADVYGLEIGAEVNPLLQESGTFGDMDYAQYTVSGGGEIDGLTAFTTAGTDVTIFTADNDYIIVGDAATFSEIEVLLDTVSSGAGIAPTFEFSTGGAGFTTFVPADGTNGMRNNGIIAWLVADLVGWATNASGNFEIKVTRTRNTLSTVPIESLIQIAATTQYMWDKDGFISASRESLVGTSDVVQFSVTGNTAQTNNIVEIKNFGGVDILTVEGGGITRAIDMRTGAPEWGWVNNLGLVSAAGTTTIGGFNLGTLSATNIAYVTMENTISGKMFQLPITANISFNDDAHASSDITGQEWGVTTGVAWGEDRPFYIYVINTDNLPTGLKYCITPDPTKNKAPATAAEIGRKGSPSSNNADTDIFVLDGSVTGVIDAPMMLIGGFRMQMSTSDDWTVQSISYIKGDGIRKDPFVGVEFLFPTEQMGSRALYHWGNANSPTYATPANLEYPYKIGLDGMVDVMYTTRDGGVVTNGTGTTAISLFLPYEILQTIGQNFVTIGGFQAQGTASRGGALLGDFNNGSKSIVLVESANFANTIQNNDFTVTTDDFTTHFRYQAFRRE